MPVSPPQVMAQILKDMGITEYEPRVINQMLEFAYSKRGRAGSARGSRGWSREVLCGAGKCWVEQGRFVWSRECSVGPCFRGGSPVRPGDRGDLLQL